MSVLAPRGFVAAGGHVGIKAARTPDCAIVAPVAGAVSGAGVFTSNLAAAAPVLTSRRHLAVTGGTVRAVVITSGNANAATGAAGLDGAASLCGAVAQQLGSPPEEVLVAQTGLIGVPFDFERCASRVGALARSLGSSASHGEDAAAAILTTDTCTKTFSEDFGGFIVGAMAKGAAMLAPNMATMLAVLTTDAACDPATLADALRAAVVPTFNRVHVDGATSTNDTVFVLASGVAGPVDPDAVASALHGACASLARQMVDDAEGATKTATVTVTGATTDHDAHVGARAVGGSLLVKCSLNGADPYWGRIASELGAAGIGFDLDRLRIAYGGVPVCIDGVAAAHDAAAVASHLASRHVEIGCDLGLGTGAASVLCCDLGEGYLAENRATS